MTYWEKRGLQRLKEVEKSSEEIIKKTISIYNKALEDIDKEIKYIYEVYSEKSGLNMLELKKIMSSSETEKMITEFNKLISNIPDSKVKKQLLARYSVEAYKSRINRLEALKEKIYLETNLIASKEELVNYNHYYDTVQNSYFKNIYDTQLNTGLAFSFSQLNPVKINRILNADWHGRNYSKSIWNNTGQLAENLQEIITSSIASGKSYQKMANEVKNLFEVANYKAIRLIRTESNHFHNLANLLAYKEEQVEKYQFVATLDNRTSEICANLDGKIFKLSDAKEGVNYPNMHVNCRSITIAVFDDDCYNNLEERTARDENGKLIKVPGNTTYEEWSKQYAPEIYEKYFENSGLSSNTKYTFGKHPKPKLLENINVKDENIINNILEKYENIIKDDKIENAIVITTKGNVYQCFGNSTNVWPDIDLGDELKGAIVSHNHPKTETNYSFSQADINLFEKYNLKRLRGIDEKYLYEFDRGKKCNMKRITISDDIEDITYEHIKSVDYSVNNNILYRREQWTESGNK